ncbi:MAG: hypothetical protein NTX79_08185, partial [Candidatus Micrarchaeota archaeon]|nr:hypothetical protein [Candidatus Micrarchaeota archaeon]
MNGEAPSTPATPPYVDTRDLGWCAPCTYATLAVQKVDFGATTNPGGFGTPKPYACYEYRAEFNYIPDAQIYPYGHLVGDAPAAAYSGALRQGSLTSPSTEIVRKESNPSAYERDTNGNLVQGRTDGNGYHFWTDGNGYHFYCQDQWHGAGGWWPSAELPTPSAPYLKEKLTSYLQSNVMPILDEQSSKTQPPPQYTCQKLYENPYAYCPSTGWYYSSL